MTWSQLPFHADFKVNFHSQCFNNLSSTLFKRMPNCTVSQGYNVLAVPITQYFTFSFLTLICFEKRLENVTHNIHTLCESYYVFTLSSPLRFLSRERERERGAIFPLGLDTHTHTHTHISQSHWHLKSVCVKLSSCVLLHHTVMYFIISLLVFEYD